MSFGRARVSTIIFTFAFCALIATAQQPGPPDQAPPPVQPAPPAQTAPSTTTPAVVTQPTRPPQEPAVLEDGGFSIEPLYWLTKAQPAMYGGLVAANNEEYESLGYPGKSDYGLGAELAIPTGHSNTLRFSYFRVLGNANNTLLESPTIFGEAYTAGDYLEAHYNLQSAKLSWDYLSYTWHKKPGNIHFKTLYEIQFVTISTSTLAPFLPVTTDSSGNTDDNTASGSKRLFLPSLGGELEQSFAHRFRWEIKASGFGIPHHSDIWDAQADLAFRISNFELIAGEKDYHFKTSPKSEQYFSDTLNGLFVGIRYYLGTPKK